MPDILACMTAVQRCIQTWFAALRDLVAFVSTSTTVWLVLSCKPRRLPSMVFSSCCVAQIGVSSRYFAHQLVLRLFQLGSGLRNITIVESLASRVDHTPRLVDHCLILEGKNKTQSLDRKFGNNGKYGIIQDSRARDSALQGNIEFCDGDQMMCPVKHIWPRDSWKPIDSESSHSNRKRGVCQPNDSCLMLVDAQLRSSYWISGHSDDQNFVSRQ